MGTEAGDSDVGRAGRPNHDKLDDDTVATPVARWGEVNRIESVAGTKIAGYVIEDEVGRGGMGVVYRACDPALDRTVALKLMLPSLSGDEVFRERFTSETRIAATLESHHVLPVFRAGEAEGHLFMSMPFVEGAI